MALKKQGNKCKERTCKATADPGTMHRHNVSTRVYLQHFLANRTLSRGRIHFIYCLMKVTVLTMICGKHTVYHTFFLTSFFFLQPTCFAFDCSTVPFTKMGRIWQQFHLPKPTYMYSMYTFFLTVTVAMCSNMAKNSWLCGQGS